ncbi:MAG TPA: chemotaxis protein CheB, partial [Aliarcobacter cryaerophilus]|nr:chemotaxis protein CheB [Aliarcobacter cryaerophilus]
KELFDNGAYTVAQNEESCVVFGMPMKAIQAGAVKDIVHLDEIADYIIDFSKGRRSFSSYIFRVLVFVFRSSEILLSGKMFF